jgi:phospho-N-acetylmuramoyl-pentapeptide-transferase
VSDINISVPYPAWYFLTLYTLYHMPFGLGILVLTLVIGALPTFVVTALLGPRLISFLRARAARQTAYEDAPRSHQAKTGTPTMGGLLFAIPPLVAVLLFPSRQTLALAILVYACMAIGVFDDMMAIQKQKNRGLRARSKFALTAVVAVIFLAVAGPQQTSFVGIGLVPPWLWYGLSVAVVLSTTHAVNLTDGLDGLASGTIVPPLLVMICAAGMIDAPLEVPFFAAAVVGAVLGFLLYNRHPARLFMGDTGSLALGGALAGVAILTHSQLLLILIGGVFAAETLSVIIQVVSFKTTRRRVFLMSPLHHHFELAGWPETKVTSRFWLASLVLSLVGFALIARTA